MVNIKPRAGDLVRFYSGFEPFTRQYESRNPGIVLNVIEKSDLRGGWSSAQSSAEVRWSDGTITTEHSGYVVVMSENEVSHV